MRRARLSRLGAGGPGTGGSSPTDLVALTSVGFRPVHEVAGLTVVHGRPDRPWARVSAYGPTVVTSSEPVRGGITNPVHAVKQGYRDCLRRLREEAAAAGADGVIDVRVARTPTDGSDSVSTYSATGTAVRSTGRVHPAEPFTALLGAVDFSVLLRAGWAPASVLVVPVLGVGFVGTATRTGMRRLAGNGELTPLADLLAAVRDRARTDLTDQVARSGADGCLIGDLSAAAELDGTEPLARASVTLTATSVVAFGSRTPHPSTTVSLA